jgi:hypothetical protein
MELNGLIVFGLIFLLITLFVGPRLTKEVPEGSCDSAYKDLKKIKAYYKGFLIASSAMIIIGLIIMFLG